uniref:Zinc finger PHD-type domain-containing protein n=1 Tax=Panagrolaimus sp. PS1159 TaxID=55785 RepID=A0AC35EUB3_9BILA
MRSEPSGSVSTPRFAPPKMKEQTFSRSAEASIFEASADLKNATSSNPISPPEKNNLAGSSKSCANKSSENLSANCKNFKLNHLIHMNSQTPNITVTNEQAEKTLPFIPEISVNQVEISHISSTKSYFNDMSSTVEINIKETQILENKNNSKENCHKELESILPLENLPQKSISPTSNAKSVKSPEKQNEDICMNNEYIENKNEEFKEQNVEKTEKIEIGNEMTKEDEMVTEDSEDAQEFELLIEASSEPLTENPTTELVVEEEYSQSEDNDVDEILDPDECPVKCICGFNHLEQQTIFCEKCRVWKHIKCLKAEKYANSDDEYFCPDCNDKNLPISPSDAQDLVAKSLKLEHLDSTLKQCYELKFFGALSLEWKSLLQNSGDCISSKVGKLIYERRMRWAVVKKGQAGRLLAGFGIKAGAPVIGVNGIAAYMTDAKNYCTCYRNLSLSFLSEPIIIEMKGRNGGLAHEILPSCRPNCEIKFSIYKNNLYCYLVAMYEIDDDDELTIAFPDNDNLHVSCAESSSECTDKCPSQKVSRLSKIKKDISRDETPTKKHKRF